MLAIEFIETSKAYKIKDEYLQHMTDLRNVAFSEDDIFQDVLNKLKIECQENEQKVVDEFASNQDEGVTEMLAKEIAGIDNGFYIFNFFEKRQCLPF